jgi:hypothetical protein
MQLDTMKVGTSSSEKNEPRRPDFFARPIERWMVPSNPRGR